MRYSYKRQDDLEFSESIIINFLFAWTEKL